MQKFSEVDICKEFEHKDKDKIIRYIELMYSKESKLNEIQNLSERKIQACKLAKLDYNLKGVKEIINLQNEPVRGLIVYFLSFYQNNNAVTQLMVDQQLLWSIHNSLLKPLEVKDDEDIDALIKKRSQMSLAGEELTKRVNRQYTEIYASQEAKEAAYQMIAQMKRPEDRVKERVQENG
jgi:hypothetical protein